MRQSEFGDGRVNRGALVKQAYLQFLLANNSQTRGCWKMPMANFSEVYDNTIRLHLYIYRIVVLVLTGMPAKPTNPSMTMGLVAK